MYHNDEPDCSGCGRYDHGFDMPDVRSTLYISTCEGGEDCEEGDCDCESIAVKVTIRRIFDRECNLCGGCDYRCVYDLSLDDQHVKRFESESDADAYAAKVFPTAKAPERDYAWESEAGLRRAEGWG